MMKIESKVIKNVFQSCCTNKRTLFTCHKLMHKDERGKQLSEHQRKLMAKHLPKRREIEGVKNVIIVASGKGGVGKSTTAVNLAMAISDLRSPKENVGLLDMDIFGPSLPKMMQLKGEPRLDKNENMIPLMNYGIQCMSMGFLIDEHAPVVWRGPMVISAVQRLLLRTAWKDVDYLVMDLPPGTGDTQLSISQLVKVDGSVIVSTPQDIALIDAYKGAEMFKKVEIPILGIVQNMNVFICSKCGHQEHIFGKDGAEKFANDLDVPILGNVPLDMSIRVGADKGQPILITHPNSTQADSYRSIAQSVLERLETIRKR